LILDETFPDYQTVLAGLPEEPTPVTLLILTWQFFQPEDMDAKETAIPLADPTVTHHVAASLPIQTGGATTLLELSTASQLTQAEDKRMAALTAFLQAPRIGDAEHMHLEDVSILLHLLLDTPGRLIAFSRIIPPIPSEDATKIWEAWSTHLAHEETPGPNGYLASDFFAKILTSSSTNPGEQAEVESLIRLYVRDTVKDSTIRTHTMGAHHDVQIPQSSSKRGRENAEDTEDTGTYQGHPTTSNPSEEDPTPQQDPSATTVAESPLPSPL
jgi:hypothetical protein